MSESLNNFFSWTNIKRNQNALEENMGECLMWLRYGGRITLHNIKLRKHENLS